MTEKYYSFAGYVLDLTVKISEFVYKNFNFDWDLIVYTQEKSSVDQVNIFFKILNQVSFFRKKGFLSLYEALERPFITVFSPLLSLST